MNKASIFAFSAGGNASEPQSRGTVAALANLPVARVLYRLRRRREQMFSSNLFSEPTWDLLLDLMAAEKAGNSVSITSACIATATPTTTALRCLKRLEGEGIVYREADPKDGRRIYIRLSEQAMKSMETLLGDLER